MYNSDLPNRAELPTSKQLLRSTITAAIVAATLLITTVLPAEYGIDPTGVGKLLGLTKMGEIKTSLEAEVHLGNTIEPNVSVVKEEKITLPKRVISPPENEVAIPNPTLVVSDAELAIETSMTSHQRVLTLNPGEAAEIKLSMVKDATVHFEWKVDKGHINYDTHGDSVSISYHGYGKGKRVTQDEGELTAAFDGKHGWFWRNRSEENVTIVLVTKGNYESIHRVL